MVGLAMTPIALAGADHCRVCHGVGLQGLYDPTKW